MFTVDSVIFRLLFHTNKSTVILRHLKRWPVQPSLSNHQLKNQPFHLKHIILLSSSPLLLFVCLAEDQKLLLPEWQQVRKKKTLTQAISSSQKNPVKPRDEIRHVQSICAAAFHSCWCKSQSGLADVGCCPPAHRSCPHGSLTLAPLTPLARAVALSNPTATCRAHRSPLLPFSFKQSDLQHFQVQKLSVGPPTTSTTPNLAESLIKQPNSPSACMVLQQNDSKSLIFLPSLFSVHTV